MINTAMNNKCPHSEFCGGCSYSGEDYLVSLKNKEGEVRGYFRVKDLDIAPIFQGIVGAEDYLFGYRNKMEYTFGDLVKGGDLQLGMHKKGNFMSIITVDNCLLVPQDFNKILRFTLDFCISRGYTHYNKKSHTGLLRNLIVRRGVRTGELLVDIVTASDEASGDLGFDEEAWKGGLLALKLDEEIVGIMRTINDGIADTVACDEQRILFGRDYYCEEICGLRFKVKVFSFFQINVEAVERLYSEAISLIPDLEGKIVYDLFCGTGTISQIAAKKAEKVIGVEIVEDSVEAARANTELNGINNCEFIQGDVYKVLTRTTESHSQDIKSFPEPDVIILDPPRMGLQTKTVNKVASYGIPEILYISCNPKTLAADIDDFRREGYEPKYLKAYDNFPWTKHVETVVLMSRVEGK